MGEWGPSSKEYRLRIGRPGGQCPQWLRYYCGGYLQGAGELSLLECHKFVGLIWKVLPYLSPCNMESRNRTFAGSTDSLEFIKMK